MRTLWMVLVVVAFTARALIPAGFMPDFSGHKVLTVCDGIHHMQPASGRTGDSQHSDHHPIPCPFSIGTLYDTVALLMPPLLAQLFIAVPPVRMEAQLLTRPAFLTASPRSPPAFF